MDTKELLRQQQKLANKGKALGLTPSTPKPKAEDGEAPEKKPEDEDEDMKKTVSELSERVKNIEAAIEDLKKDKKEDDDANATAFKTAVQALESSNRLMAEACDRLKDPAKAQAMSAGQPAWTKSRAGDASGDTETQASKDHAIRKQWLAMPPGAEANRFYKEHADSIARARI